MLTRALANRRVLCQTFHDSSSITQKLIPLFWCDFSPHVAPNTVPRNNSRSCFMTLVSPHDTSLTSIARRSFTHSSFDLFGAESQDNQGDPPPTLEGLIGNDGDPEEIETEKISVTFR